MYRSVLELIGQTPLVRINHADEDGAEIYAKIEAKNPSFSVKDRAAYYIVKDLMDKGELKEGGGIVEATSGNTGVALSMIGAALGLKVTIVMPESMTLERRRLMKAYGADLVLTGEGGMQAAVDKAKEISEEKGYPMLGQFIREANVLAHYETTGPEILAEIPDLDGFVAGIGTGGTVTGTGKFLKENNEDIVVWGVEPEASPLLNKGEAGGHKIQGLGANFVPDIYNSSYIDKVAMVSNEDAIEEAVGLARKEGILSGISSGANLSAAKRLAKDLGKGKKIVVILPDTGERYLSSGIFDD